MPVPSSISDLSTTAGSNSPAGTDPIGTDADNYIRAHAAFIAQLRDGSKNLELGTATAPALAFTGDSNTGIFSPTADTVNIATGGSTRMTVNSTGVAVGGTSVTGYFLVKRYNDGADYWRVGPSDTTSGPLLNFYNYGTASTCMNLSSTGVLTVTGLIKGNNGGSGLGQITVSTSAPSGGSDGDLWLRYE